MVHIAARPPLMRASRSSISENIDASSSLRSVLKTGLTPYSVDKLAYQRSASTVAGAFRAIVGGSTLTSTNLAPRRSNKSINSVRS